MCSILKLSADPLHLHSFPTRRSSDLTQIGKNCIIHSGVILGADGFGFSPNEEGVYDKVPQIGNVIIEDHVEIGAGTTIDRATLGSTIIRKGVKLDNQIQIAHNVEVGQNKIGRASCRGRVWVSEVGVVAT